MNPQELKIAKILKKIQKEQPADSQFWLPDGGTHVFELAKWAGMTEVEALSVANALQTATKAVITMRADGKEGLKLTQTAIDEINALDEAQRIADEAQGVINAQIARDNEITGIMARAKQLLLTEAFPINSIFISVSPINPATSLGYGTWSAFGTGRVLVGVDAAQSEFDVVEKTGGAKTHTLQITEIPSHNHIVTSQTATTGGATSYEHGVLDTSSAEAEATEVTANTGGGLPHNNLQPFITVFMWKRLT